MYILCHILQITVPKGCCVFLRFKAGQSLKKIMGETGTHFRFFYNRRFTNADGTADIVIVSGSDESQVYEACKKIGLVLKNVCSDNFCIYSMFFCYITINYVKITSKFTLFKFKF